jgi:hypothetical protein
MGLRVVSRRTAGSDSALERRLPTPWSGVAIRGWDTAQVGRAEEANDGDQVAVARAACSISFTKRAE